MRGRRSEEDGSQGEVGREMEERKVTVEEIANRMENEQSIMFMDPSGRC